MTDKATRATIDFANETLDGLCKRPLMYGGNMHGAELLATYMLEVLHTANRTSEAANLRSYRDWINERYPDIPGSIRSIEAAMNQRHGDAVKHDQFTKELKQMIEDLR